MTEMNQDSLLASEWNKMEEMVQVLEPFASHTDMCRLTPHLCLSSFHHRWTWNTTCSNWSAAKTVTNHNSADIFLALIRVHAAARVPDITNFNPVPVAACLMDPTVRACLLSPELAGLHAAKLYVIQQAAKETQPATDNSDSTTASSPSVIFVNENENENEKDRQFVHENEN